MSETAIPAGTTPGLMDSMLRQYEVEQFYYAESGLLDDRNFEPWIDLFTDDSHYFMPIRRTRTRKELDREFTQPGEMAFFDDTKPLLASRIDKLGTGRSWSEDPPSRVRHLITNVRVVTDDGHEMDVRSNFHVHRTRLHAEVDDWIGSRSDTLRRVDGGLRIARRHIFLEQTVLQAPNLTVFF